MKVYIKIPFEQETNEGAKKMFDLKEIDLSELMEDIFDKGFDISNEKFNAEIRDDYEAFDSESEREYKIKRNEIINKFLTEKGYIQL